MLDYREGDGFAEVGEAHVGQYDPGLGMLTASRRNLPISLESHGL